MSRKPKSLAQKLHDAQVAIDNTIAIPQIQEAVEPLGYGPDHMLVGRSLYEAALAAVQSQRAARGAQQNATARLKEKQKEAFAAYQSLAQVARAIYRKTPTKLVVIGLDIPMPRTTAAFILAGYKLFDNAALKTELAGFGYSLERLESERTKISDFEQANLEQEAAKGAAQHATQAQKTAMKALNDWVRQYLRIARVALRSEEQLLEKLGVLIRSGKTAAQRQAPRKAAATRAANRAAEEEPEPELI